MARKHVLIKRRGFDLKLYATLFGILFLAVLLVKLGAGVMSLTSKDSTSPTFIEVPAPKNFIPAGSELRIEDFEMVKVPASSVTDNIITDRKAFKGVSAKTDLLAGQPVKSSSLVSSKKVSSVLQEKIPAGMRAMTLDVDATTSVEGWALPGSVVDILLVKPNGKTHLVAERVQIISVGGNLEGDPSNPNMAKTLTILVTQEQALAIASALPLGRLAFTLRGVSDEQFWKIRHFDADKLGSTASPTARLEGIVKFTDQNGKEMVYTLSDGKLIPAEVKELGPSSLGKNFK
ncbi:MAG: Flp pilus assembly protein CpaB [Deltaproteobacteria bacterium]|nr:Flp pilus assembly protein CpaB [Deltaproteobacteria bacterium]